MRPIAAVLDIPVVVRRATIDLLAHREHGRTELSHKLHQRGASTELTDPALGRLAKEGLLGESRYLENFTISRARSNHGSLRIREELAQRGLPRTDIERALGACKVDQSTQLRKAWHRKFIHPPQDAGEKA